MKNKYLKGAHLSERKFKEILKLFADDLTATQIASISGVSRVTINSYLKKIRQQIARSCEEGNPGISQVTAQLPEEDLSESVYDQDTLVAVKPEVGKIIKPVIFGIYKQEERVHTEILPDVSRSMVHAVVRGRSGLETLGAVERIRLFRGLVDLGQYRLYRLENGGTEKADTDDVDAFWALTRHRLAKFKGLNRNTAYLHLKECEFRYNSRHEDLYAGMLNLLKTYPLTLA
ncbi:IS1595 family transposase [Chitinophaga defluvii]|uniref:IS1595 family transposase n=1 Tax=Chitinophaga defluvii TaxID=3163343 RepID=A0ABV2TBD6_9BACT